MPEGAVDALRPELSAAADEARRVWNVMGEWRPESIPVIVEMMEIEHVDGLIERLLAIRAGIVEHRNDNG